MRHLELKIPPVAVFLVAGAAMWGIARKVPQAEVSIAGAGIVAVFLVLIAGGLAIPAILRFRHHDTTVHPNKPEKASAIVTTGIYRYTRNPMYLGLVFLLTAWALKLGNIAAFLGIPLFVAYMTHFQIKPEERALQSLFGTPFDDYMESVRRWI